MSLYHLQFARFFTQKTPNSIPAALAVAALSVHAESKDDEVITDDLMSNHKQDLDFVKSLIEVEPVVEFSVQNTLTDGIFETGGYGVPSKSQNPTILYQGGPSSNQCSNPSWT